MQKKTRCLLAVMIAIGAVDSAYPAEQPANIPRSETIGRDTTELIVESFKLNYTNGEDVVAILANGQQRILSSSGSAVADRRTNTLFVQDTRSSMDNVREAIKRIDVLGANLKPPPEPADTLVCRDEKYTEVLSLSGLPPGLLDPLGRKFDDRMWMADHDEELNPYSNKRVRFDIAAMSNDCLFVATEYWEHGYFVEFALYMRDGHEWNWKRGYGGGGAPKSFKDLMRLAQQDYWYAGRTK